MKPNRLLPSIAVITNSRSSNQYSMIGYGDHLLQCSKQFDYRMVEWRSANLFSRMNVNGRLRKVAHDIDRFAITPVCFLGRRADLLHVIDPGNSIYIPITCAHRKIITVHDIIPYLCAEGTLVGFRPSLAGQFLMKRILQHIRMADHVITVSERSKNDLARLTGIPSRRISVVHNPPIRALTPANDNLQKCVLGRYGLEQVQPFILHIGRNFYKNRKSVLDIYASAKRRHPELRLVVIGLLEPELRHYAQTLSLTGSIHEIAQVGDEDLSALYSAAHVLLFPSIYEGFGYPVLEAQMCGTPVICSNAGALPEIAGSGAVIFPPHDVESMANAVVALLEDLPFRLSIIESGTRNAARFSQAKWVDAHNRIYKQVLSATYTSF